MTARTETSVEAGCLTQRLRNGLRKLHQLVNWSVGYPRHFVLFSAVLGLVFAPKAPIALAVIAMLFAPLLAYRPTETLACLLALFACGWIAQLRVAAIDGTKATQLVGMRVDTEAALQESVRMRTNRLAVTRVRFTEGQAKGETAVIHIRQRGHREDPLTAPKRGWPDIGALVRVQGRVTALGHYDQYQRRRGTQVAVEATSLPATGKLRSGFFGALDRTRSKAQQGFRSGLAPPEEALLRGMVLGQDDRLSRSTKEAFRLSGLTHILAVSGQNVTLLAAFILATGALLGLPLRLRLFCALTVVALYIPLTGSAASIQRAGIMGAVTITATLVGRPSSRWYALGLAALGTLLLNPYAIEEPGWQLSFAAVIGLLALNAPLREALLRKRLPRPIAEATAMTVAASIATAPLLAAIFQQVSLASLPANVLAAPAIAPVMWLGMISTAVSQIEPQLAEPVNLLNSGFLVYIKWVAHLTAKAPGSSIHVEMVSLLGVGLITVVCGSIGLIYRSAKGMPPLLRRSKKLKLTQLLKRPRNIIPASFGVIALASLTIIAWPQLFSGEPKRNLVAGTLVVSFLDIGQGDATLLQRDNVSVLVDTGPPDGPIIRRLEQAGVRRLDALMLTHPEADHEGAAIEVIRKFRPRLIVNNGGGRPTYVQKRLPTVKAEVRAREITVEAGQSLKVGDIKFHVLWPPPGLPAITDKSNPNKRAIVSIAQVGEFKLFLPADATSDVTAPLIDQPVDAMKVAHHGSADPGLPALLNRIRPSIAAIEVGRHNTYGHPKPKTVAALKTITQHVYRTDHDGTVRLSVKGRKMSVERVK